MALETAGRGDKLGNRYEGWWVARQLLYVIQGRFRSVRVEAIGADEEGVDLWVTLPDGTRVAQQCKADNAHLGKWTVANLDSRGVLAHIHEQLTANPSARFTFVSGVDAPELRALAERASSCVSPADYAHYQVNTKELEPAFTRFCQAIRIDPKTPEELVAAHDILRRTEVHLFARSSEGQADVEALARFLIVGMEPRSVVAYLTDFVLEHFDQEPHADVLLNALREQHGVPRNLVREPSLVPRMSALNDAFDDSIRPLLIGGSLISRSESRTVIKQLSKADAKPITVVHGQSGDGKSGVLLEVVEHLRVNQIPYLALRMDRPIPAASARRYGEILDLPGSPSESLAAVACGRPGVLILDQLDAVRWTAAHSSAAWDGCREMLTEARSLGNIHILLACRTFDWREDPQLKHWSLREQCEEIEVGLLPEDDVQRVINAAGVDSSQLDPRQKSLLRSPQCLVLWSTLHADGQAPLNFRTTTDLMRAFWQNRREKLTLTGLTSSEVDVAINAVVEDMEANGRLNAPERLLNRFPNVKTQIQSMNLVTVTGKFVSFAHQSYLDFLVAERVLADLSSQGGTLLSWLKRHEQSLFRREQLRQVLQLLRDEDEAKYLTELADLLAREEIRFHLKHLILQHLGQADPPLRGEVALVTGLLAQTTWRDQFLTLVLFKRPAWLGVLIESGGIQSLLASEDEALVDHAIWLLWGWAETSGNEVAELLRPYLNRSARWTKRAHAVVQFHECETSRALFGIKCDLIRRGEVAGHELLPQKLPKVQPSWCAELLEARLSWMADHWHEVAQERLRGDDAFPIIIGKPYFEWIEPSAKMAPVDIWDRLVPLIERLVIGAPSPRPPAKATFVPDAIWYSPGMIYQEDGLDVIRLIATAAGAMGHIDPGALRARIEAISSSKLRTMQRLAICALLEAPVSLSDFAVNWVCDQPARFRLDLWFDEGRWELARRLIQRFATCCSEEAYTRLERTILNYHEKYEFESIRYHASDFQKNGILRDNYYGRPQGALLDSLPPERVSPDAKDLKGVLDRKFGASLIRPARDYEFRPVSSDLSNHAIQRFSDRTWLQLIGRPPSDRLRISKSGDYIQSDPLAARGESRLSTGI